MSRYKKKPVEVEAVQFTRKNIIEVMKFTNHQVEIAVYRPVVGKMTGRIQTLEGYMILNENDWIIKGVKGEFYPCKPDIFKKTYEKVDK